MDTDYLAERIIKDLDGIFAKDPHIADFEILPVQECTKNKCPVIHIAHQVGLESWCVKHVFQYAYKNTMDWRINRQQGKIPCLLGWTRVLLLINPDIPVAWNIRKELVNSEKQDIHSELKFSAIALSRKPKSAEAFIHRRWILNELMKLNNTFKILPSQADIEFQLCNKAAENYPQNYYAWGHRIWVVQSIDASHYQVVRLELQNSDAWTQKHISDHSGFHYRQFLYTWLIENMKSDKDLSSAKKNNQSDARKLSDTEENALSLLLSELETNAESILFYDDGHESLWYHRRFILRTLKSIVPILNDSNIDSPQNRQNAKRTKLDILKECFNVGNEENFIERVREKNRDNMSNAQKLFLEKHIQWLRKFFAKTLSCEGNTKI